MLAIGCEDGNIYVCEARNQGYLYKMQKVLRVSTKIRIKIKA